jgi:hypothetical protein
VAALAVQSLRSELSEGYRFVFGNKLHEAEAEFAIPFTHRRFFRQ